ncbi:MAG: hypothetical protein QOG72_3381 [Sphingomonadales bacterium]|jgi:hypothetical protein|nr:hypothetical protein [Sphingomonadales bacterium]
MSASVPARHRSEEFQRIPDASLEIEQAVVSLTRAVLSEGGTLVFGGHPAISPLVATVAGEYRPTRFAESGLERPRAQVQIYQSKIFLGHAPEETMLMFSLGLADVHWIDKDPGENFDDPPPGKGPRFPLSLRRMREAMIGRTKPDCMVAIGGMEGVIEEARLFRDFRQDRPLCVLKGTGGASLILGEKVQGPLDFVDERVMAERDRRRRERPPEPEEKHGLEDLRREEVAAQVIPYPLIMQTIVEQLAQGME